MYKVIGAVLSFFALAGGMYAASDWHLSTLYQTKINVLNDDNSELKKSNDKLKAEKAKLAKENIDLENKIKTLKVHPLNPNNAEAVKSLKAEKNIIAKEKEKLNKESIKLLNQVKILKKENLKLKTEIVVLNNNQEVSGYDFSLEPYENGEDKFSIKLKPGEAYVDSETGFAVGISSIYLYNEADGTVSIPGKESIKYSNIKPGQSWEFKNYKYIFMLDSENSRYGVKRVYMRQDNGTSKPVKLKN